MQKNILSQFIARHVREYSSIYLFIMVLFLMGVIFGAIIVNSLSLSQKGDLFFYLNQFFDQVAEGKVAQSDDLFRLSFWHNAKYLGLIWILGISIIGLPIILILLFLKGIVVGFSVGFLVHQMGWNGFLLAFVAVLPQNLFMIPLFIYMSAISVGLSLLIIRKIFMKKTFTFPIMPVMMRYLIAFILVIAFVGAAAGLEAYLSPYMMKSVLQSTAS
ncbi:stage II sporulation protein M [Bacillus chungangensis]|uniref:Stage II sporulation protein M n=1 Tax=Bacillus chungangensis TaxID=587633 RepID=A0ABT9WPB6_9BACI|nr:stage II sporulation protein M [Bacillus chungangensis]MDQ0175055.1 stage II sporulation protein M [Bacillus chungangensis]